MHRNILEEYIPKMLAAVILGWWWKKGRLITSLLLFIFSIVSLESK